MGICSSCLGFARWESQSEPADSAHLLGDPYQPHFGGYGSINADHRRSPQVDPEEIQRQRDALERLCEQTSDKLIDVTQPTNAELGPKLTKDYARLFAERFTPRNQPVSSRPSSSGDTMTHEDDVTWLGHIVEEGQGTDPLGWQKLGKPGALSMQFDEVLGFESRLNGKSPKLW